MDKFPHTGDRKIRILIIRPSSMGDVVMASSLLNPLKTAYPNASIAWLLEAPLLDLLRAHPLVAEVLPWDKKAWKQGWKSRRIVRLLSSVREFRKLMLSKKFDLALEAQGLLRGRMLAWLSGARKRIGFESKEPGSFLLTRVISRGPNDKRLGSEYYYMMKAMGVEPSPPFRPYLVVPQGCAESSKGKLMKKGLGNKYAVLCPFTTRPQKHWFDDRWAHLARLIYERFSLPSVLMGGPQDRGRAELIAESSKGAAVSLAGQTTLGEAMAVVRDCSVMVGVDTGLTHMGAAFDVPTVALFGATCPYLHTHTDKFVVLYHELDCSPCKRSPVCEGDFRCMKNIEVKEVLDAVEKVLTE